MIGDSDYLPALFLGDRGARQLNSTSEYASGADICIWAGAAKQQSNVLDSVFFLLPMLSSSSTRLDRSTSWNPYFARVQQFLLATGSSLFVESWFHWQQQAFWPPALYLFKSFYDFLSVVQICTNGSFLWHTGDLFAFFVARGLQSFLKCWWQKGTIETSKRFVILLQNLSKDGTGRKRWSSSGTALNNWGWFTGTLSPCGFIHVVNDTPFLKVTCQQHSASWNS